MMLLSAGRDGVVSRVGRCCQPGRTVLSAGRDGVVGRARRCCWTGETVLLDGRDGVVDGIGGERLGVGFFNKI